MSKKSGKDGIIPIVVTEIQNKDEMLTLVGDSSDMISTERDQHKNEFNINGPDILFDNGNKTNFMKFFDAIKESQGYFESE